MARAGKSKAQPKASGTTLTKKKSRVWVIINRWNPNYHVYLREIIGEAISWTPAVYNAMPFESKSDAESMMVLLRLGGHELGSKYPVSAAKIMTVSVEELQ